jgi:hypothetical protein
VTPSSGARAVELPVGAKGVKLKLMLFVLVFHREMMILCTPGKAAEAGWGWGRLLGHFVPHYITCAG